MGDGSNCKVSGQYIDYMTIANACADKSSCYPFSFQSDIWNGYGGDGGWSGCDAQNSPNTNCQFAVKNIKLTGVDGNVFEASNNTAGAVKSGFLQDSGAATGQNLWV